jgi:hypothetical protein
MPQTGSVHAHKIPLDLFGRGSVCEIWVPLGTVLLQQSAALSCHGRVLPTPHFLDHLLKVSIGTEF